MPSARPRHLLIAAGILALLAAGLPALRARWQRVAGTPPPERPSAVRLPELDRAALWIGDRAPIAPGTPLALVVFSTTDPRASDVLAEAEAWHDAYGSRGVRVIGLHRPEFAFAADSARLARTLERHGISFPVAHDPALAVPLPSNLPVTAVIAGEAGRQGFAATHAAERAETDAWLRAEARVAHVPESLPGREGRRLMRLGAGHVTRGPLAGVSAGVTTTFVTQTRIEEEGREWTPVPVGRWTPRGDGLEAARGGAANFVAIRYHAARAGVVVSPPPGRTARLWVLRDEAWVPNDVRGADVRADAAGATWVDVDEPKLLMLTREDQGWHVLKLSPDQPGVVLHALTFDRP